MKIGDHVIRKDPGGHDSYWIIDSPETLKYHQGLQDKGYIYEVQGKKEIDFDLPEDTKKATAPRIHIAGDTCTNCEA